MVEGDRLTLAFAAAADRAGADLANHAEAIEAIRDEGRIGGMLVRDRLTGKTLPVRARVTLNAAGARAGEIMAMLGVRRAFPLLKAMNLVTSKPASDMALGAPAPGGRMLTLVPWRGRAIVGTSQSATLVQPGDTAISDAELNAFIADANHAFPALKLSRADITLVHRGVVPAVQTAGSPELKPSPEILDHASDGAAGAITVVGVKYTTARALAERATRVVATHLGKRVRPSRTATTTLPGAGIADHEALAIETARDLQFEVALPVIRHLIALYAEAAADDHPADARARGPARAGRVDRHNRGRRGRLRHPSRNGRPPHRHRRPADGAGLGRRAARRCHRRVRPHRRRGARMGSGTHG